MECTPRIEGRGAQFTPLGWAVYYDSKKVIRHMILNTLCPVDPTFVCARWYDSVFPESSLTPLLERVAPSISFEKTAFQCNALDLAVMLGNDAVVAEFMQLSIPWNRKFDDPVGYALDLATKCHDWLAGDTKQLDWPRLIDPNKKEQELLSYKKIITSLNSVGREEAHLDQIWEDDHWLVSVHPPKELFQLVN